MAAPKGHPRYGGRTKGHPNKKTQDLIQICEDEGLDPFRAMLKQAQLIDEPKAKFDALERICQYIYPKRKALEMSNEEETRPFRVIIEDYGSK